MSKADWQKELEHWEGKYLSNGYYTGPHFNKLLKPGRYIPVDSRYSAMCEFNYYRHCALLLDSPKYAYMRKGQ